MNKNWQQNPAAASRPVQSSKILSSLLICATLIGRSVLAEAPTFRWSTRGGGDHHDYGTGIVVDNLGNTFVTGYFRGELNFDGAEQSLAGKGEADIFVAKLTASFIPPR